jgi:hypothetical protein
MGRLAFRRIVNGSINLRKLGRRELRIGGKIEVADNINWEVAF